MVIMKFGKKSAKNSDVGKGDFGYLPESAIYFDSACQSLRPQPVIDAMTEYYTKFNSCGERVKYQWGLEVDERVEATRAKILKMLKLSPKEYFVSFTTNTTYGINLILEQLDLSSSGSSRGSNEQLDYPNKSGNDNLEILKQVQDDKDKTGSDNTGALGKIQKVITSDIEHNSPFLATMTFAKKHGIPREILTRNDDGSIDLDAVDFTNAVVVLNAVSNIDARQLKNIKDVAAKIRKQNGIFIIDAAQTMANYHELIAGVEADAICFSSHKMYGPSLGVMVVRRELLKKINPTFIGGGMVDDVMRDDFVLSAKSPDHAHTAFEMGLQAYAEIIGLGVAIDWILAQKKNGAGEKLSAQSQKLFDFLKSSEKIHLINSEATTTISFYHEKIDSHLLAEALSDQGIMARSGYFCCHYYLDHVKHYPPLVRLSLGLNTRDSDIDGAIKILEGIVK
ncbi:MAG: aminotransferase class V-fold PLP-dependent enzyme [Candidatus Nomurabacteria bacterium]|jgi:cysteine desulfurase/selenocysteine lyase|nr:aminotransferase class V-fold PLP-dependent enzyme [Candidatus Nomurabacteria bacterium]